MSAFDLLFLALLIPGLVIAALIVAFVLPRALRDDERLFQNRCLHCGHDLREGADRCPGCGRSTEIEPPPPA